MPLINLILSVILGLAFINQHVEAEITWEWTAWNFDAPDYINATAFGDPNRCMGSGAGKLRDYNLKCNGTIKFEDDLNRKKMRIMFRAGQALPYTFFFPKDYFEYWNVCRVHLDIKGCDDSQSTEYTRYPRQD